MPRAPARTLALRPADPFDLIRWLARSQSDPRKAVAELVQNSIDAQARHISIERRRVRGEPALFVRDDGEGILPALGRDEALSFIATNIGSSRKRNLSPEERRRLVVTGQYGVGLLGFWSIGHRMEIRSRVAGSAVHVLRLVEDESRVSLDEVPIEIGARATFTEIVVSELHDAASRALSGRRLAEYLAAELRGPILATGAEVEVRDAMARGLAQKRFPVAPKPFTGERLQLPPEVPVEGGRPPLRVELYLARGAEGPAIQVSCAGTLVADDVAELHALDLDEAPWVGCDLAGLLEFPGFTVPPGSRRGVVPDEAAEAFARAMGALRSLVEAELRRLERERRAAADRQVVNELRRALRGLRARLPQYDLPAVPDGRGENADGGPGAAPGLDVADDAQAGDDAAVVAPELFPAGPLASARIAPEHVEVVPGREHRVRAEALDAEGRRIREGVAYRWSIEGAGFAMRGEGPRPAVTAEASVRPGAVARVRVVAEQGERSAAADAAVDAVEPSPDELGLGIPEPQLVDAPGETWRSRFDGTRWEVNQMHEDYLALKGEARARLRYLLTLLAKDLAVHAHRVPGAVAVSEDVVAILALAERNLRGA